MTERGHTPRDAEHQRSYRREAVLDAKALNRLRARGAWCFKVHGGPFQQIGVPDLIVCYRGLFIAIETKVKNNQTTPAQAYTIGKIREADGIAVVARTLMEILAVFDAIDHLLEAQDDARALPALLRIACEEVLPDAFAE